MSSPEDNPRIADTLDKTCHDLQEIVDRVDNAEAEDHLTLAIMHLEHVARWDRHERGETPTDALRDFVADGGVEQATERDMDGMGTCEFTVESSDGPDNCGEVTEHVASVLVDGKITIIPLCNRHAGSFPEEYVHG